MRKFFTSLYGKLSLGYLALLLLFCAASVYVTMQTAELFVEESAQQLNRNLADGLAHEIKPYIGDTLDLEQIQHTMHVLMVFNPWVEIYLLDDAGRIITYMAEPGEILQQQVPLEPLHAFIDSSRSFPLRSIDPKSNDVEKIFSATQIDLGGDRGTGYLYVVLHGKQYASAAAMVRDNYIMRGTAWNLLLLFGFTAAAGLLLVGLLTRRFRSLSRAVDRFAGGDLESRADVESNDEIGRLGTEFNRMADTLQANMLQLKQRDDLRREFVANITHDLKSPLTSIKGYVETMMMKNSTLGEEERLEYLGIINEDTTLLNDLVSQLLELAELEAPEIRVDREPFLACELAQDVVMKFRPKADELGVSLGSSLGYDLPMVNADIGMMERVLSNLIDNALRYTPSGGTVEVDGRTDNGRVRLTVRDTGQGIPPQDIPKITERFYKARGVTPRASGGTGLGLAIVTRVLELHNSKLQIDSTPGEGTAVSFELEKTQ